MSLGRSPSQRFRLQIPSWGTIPSGFSAINPKTAENQNWLLRLVQIIDDAVINIPKIQGRIETLKAQGKRTDYLESQMQIWVTQVQRGLDWFADLIEKSTDLQSIIDNRAGSQSTSAPATAPSDLHGVRIGAWREVVAELRKPPVLAGLGFTAVLIGVGRVLSNPAVWLGIKDVILFALPWVAGYFISDNVKQITNGSDDAKAKLEQCIAATEKANTVEEKAQVERLCGQAQAGNSWLWLILGGAAGVGALIYFQSKGHVNVIQSRSAALSGMPRKRRRRKNNV